MSGPATRLGRFVHRLKVSGLILVCFLGISILNLAWKWPFTREAATRSFEQVSLSKVEIGHFQRIFFPHPGYIADDVRITRDANSGTPPLATVGRVICRASWFAVLSLTHRVAHMRLEAVHVYIPAHVPPAIRGPGHETIKTTVSELIADGAVLEIAPRHAGSAPLRFDFSQLATHDLAKDKPIRFRTVMHTPEPPGTLAASVSFGPFTRGHAGQDPASGSFQFSNADLSCFHVIAGNLSASGNFQGTLARLEVHGKTEIPNFEVTTSHHAVGLTTEYRAVVNGTNGDIALDSATAHSLDTTLHVHGTIGGNAGKTAALDMTAQKARVEDLLRFFVTGDQPPMRGPITLHAHVVLPPGKRRFLDKLQLQGDFAIAGAQFSNSATQSKLDELSARARGEKHSAKSPASSERVSCDLSADVAVRNAVATLTAASFRIPGASVQGEGTYNLKTLAMDLHGRLAIEASLSKAAGGMKSLLLIPLDPFFKKGNAGAVLGVRMTGTYPKPAFKISLTGKK